MSAANRQGVARAATLLSCLFCAALAVAQPQSGIREAFLAAYDEARLGLHIDASGDSAALRAYVLYPYLEAARLEIAVLGTTGALGPVDTDVSAFLARHGDAPVTRSVHRQWLRRLAERAQWPAFLDAYLSELADDRMRCQYLAARIATDRLSGLAPEIAAQWRTPTQLPIECEPVFQWFGEEGLLDAELVAERVTGLLENGQSGFARVIARRLPDEVAAPFEAWAALVAEPRAALDAWLTAPTEIADRALLDGWSRLSRNAPDDALARADALFGALARQARDPGPYALALALGLAWDRRAETLYWFARVPPADLDDYALGWLARAALWAQAWPLAADAIRAMSDAERATSAWRYWGARTTEVLDGRREARPVYEALLVDDNFYSAMAAARLGRRAEPHAMRLELDAALLVELAGRPPYLRARELAAVGLRSEATLEWQQAYAELDEPERLQSIHLAAQQGLHDIAVATATRHGVFADYSLLYPRPFATTIERAARDQDLDANLLFALTRQESLFRPDATSATGALGLMQLTPATAARTARGAGLPVPARRELFEPATNVALGSAHLRDLLAQFAQQLPVALAAYNAGPAAAARWLPEDALDADIWIENVPYNETRAYVRRVLWHAVVFDWLESGRAVDIDDWLAPVGPSPAGD